MEELTIVMEALVKMGEGATTAFIWWCLKECFPYLMCPITFTISGISIFKIVKYVVDKE